MKSKPICFLNAFTVTVVFVTVLTKVLKPQVENSVWKTLIEFISGSAVVIVFGVLMLKV